MSKKPGKVWKSDKQPTHQKAPDKKLGITLNKLMLEAASLLPQCEVQDQNRVLVACVKLQEAAQLLEACHMETPDRPECPKCHRPVEKAEASWQTPEGATYHRWCTDGESEEPAPDTE